MNGNEKQIAKTDFSSNRFVKWLENFWYHYKWQCIILTFVVTVCAFCFSQCAKKETYDFCVNYTGNCTLDGNQQKALAEVFAVVAPTNPGGEKAEVALTAYSFYSEEELTSMFTVNGQLSSAAYANAKATNAEEYSNFSNFFMTGECGVYLVSPSVYHKMNSEYLVPLSESFDVIPEAAADEYAVRLSGTDFYQYYDAAKVLPEDTLVVLSRKLVWGASSKDEIYRSFVELYQNIVSFQKP